jgi:hypothetical protein
VSTLIIQLILFVLRIGAVIGLVLLWQSIESGARLGGTGTTGTVVNWLIVFGTHAIADMGFQSLHLGTAGEIWTLVPYSLFVPVGLVLIATIQAALSDWLVNRAIKLAERRG